MCCWLQFPPKAQTRRKVLCAACEVKYESGLVRLGCIVDNKQVCSILHSFLFSVRKERVGALGRAAGMSIYPPKVTSYGSNLAISPAGINWPPRSTNHPAMTNGA